MNPDFSLSDWMKNWGTLKAMKFDHILCQVNPDSSDLHVRTLLALVVSGQAYHHGPLGPLSERGAVHLISFTAVNALRDSWCQ
jgi:hypothetical protein